MLPQLNPQFPLLWRSPDSVQFGVDSPVLVLEQMTLFEEHVLHALTTGAERASLVPILQRERVSAAQLDAFLAKLNPVLRTEPPPAAPPVYHTRIAVLLNDTTDHLGEHRTLIEQNAITARSMEPTPFDFPLELFIRDFVITPESYRRALSQGHPHASIIYSDFSVKISHLVLPGRTPCLRCIDLHQQDKDPAWLALCTQLNGKTARSHTPMIRSLALSLWAHTTHRWLNGHSVEAPTDLLRLDGSDLSISKERVLPHPDCGCVQAD